MINRTLKEMKRNIDKAIETLVEAKEVLNGEIVPRMDPDEAAEHWGCSTQHVYDLIREGKLPCKYVGRKVTLLRATVLNYDSREDAEEGK